MNEPARLRKDIVRTLQEAIKDGGEKIEAALEKMTERLAVLVSDVNVLAKELKVVESLLFTRISERQRRIAEAHPRTYDWLFEGVNVEGPGSPGVSVVDWLREGSGTYWVSGKAGSGKSTLMKYLHNHEDTLTALRSWAAKSSWSPLAISSGMQGPTCRNHSRDFFKRCYTTCCVRIQL